MNYFVVYLLQCFIKALFIISLIKNALYYNNVVLFKIRLIVKFISFILNNHFFFFFAYTLLKNSFNIS